MRLYYLAQRDLRDVYRIVALSLTCDVAVELVELKDGKDLKRVSPLGISPVLERDDARGVIFSMNNILKFICSLAKDTSYTGIIPKEALQVEEYAFLTFKYLDLYANHPAECAESLFAILQHIEARLSQESKYLVGYSPTLADLLVASALCIPFSSWINDKALPNFPNVHQWLKECQERFCFSTVSISFNRYRFHRV